MCAAGPSPPVECATPDSLSSEKSGVSDGGHPGGGGGEIEGTVPYTPYEKKECDQATVTTMCPTQHAPVPPPSPSTLPCAHSFLFTHIRLC